MPTRAISRDRNIAKSSTLSNLRPVQTSAINIRAIFGKLPIPARPQDGRIVRQVWEPISGSLPSPARRQNRKIGWKVLELSCRRCWVLQNGSNTCVMILRSCGHPVLDHLPEYGSRTNLTILRSRGPAGIGNASAGNANSRGTALAPMWFTGFSWSAYFSTFAIRETVS